MNPRRTPSAQTITYEALVKTSYEVTLSHDLTVRVLEVPPPNQGLVTEYLRNVYGQKYSPALETVNIKMVVLHSMAVGDLKYALVVSKFLEDQAEPNLQKWGRLPVGAHFLVDRDGSVYCLAPPKNERGEVDFAKGRFPLRRHVIEANPFAVGIENIAPATVENWVALPEAEKKRVFADLTEAQVQANVKLIKYLKSLVRGDLEIYSHDQFAQKEFRDRLNLPVSQNPFYYTNNRYDTGEKFREAVKAGLIK